MKLSRRKIAEFCDRRGTTLTSALREAGVSRTAYYSLARKESVLPRSVARLAHALGVEEWDLVEDPPSPAERDARRLLRRARAVLDRYPEASFENVWHSLVLLEEPPLERLRRSLTRGRAAPQR